jgi:hypothetical protein
MTTVDDAEVTTEFFDDFAEGLHHESPGARWYLRPVEGFARGDGALSVTGEGLLVTPTGLDAATGTPVFAVPPAGASHEFLRWAAFTAAKSSSGGAGFDVPAGGVLTGRAELSSRMLGTPAHPLQDVTDPERDMRLGAAALICIDMASGMVFDLVMTDRGVFALYERLPRPGGDHRTFSYSVQVSDRKPDQSHALEVSLDASSGTVRYRVDGNPVLEVGDLGQLSLDRRYLLREGGGAEQPVVPAQLNFGFSVFAAGVWGQGVRLAARSLTVTTTA